MMHGKEHDAQELVPNLRRAAHHADASMHNAVVTSPTLVLKSPAMATQTAALVQGLRAYQAETTIGKLFGHMSDAYDLVVVQVSLTGDGGWYW